MQATTKRDAALELARMLGLVRPRDFEAHGIPRSYLRRLCGQGLLTRLDRGLYQFAEAEIEANHSLAEAAKRVPHGVVCLLSALRFHELTTQQPPQVWMAIAPKARAPRLAGPRLAIVRASGAALAAGIERHPVEGVAVPVYGIAKTVADCFKYRNRVGLDVAIEALRECRRERRASIDDIWRYAEVDRVTNVMRPYMEALSS